MNTTRHNKGINKVITLITQSNPPRGWSRLVKHKILHFDSNLVRDVGYQDFALGLFEPVTMPQVIVTNLTYFDTFKNYIFTKCLHVLEV